MSKFCPKCGNPVEADTPGGLCAACLLKPGLESPVESMNAQTTPFERHFTAPSAAELAVHFPELEIMKLLGQGGMGAVYQARQLRLDRLVALKILPKVAGQEVEFANRFAREARAMARLNHPNIVNIHDYGDKAGWFFFIMEYVDGVNLREAIKAKSIEPKEALTIVGQVCDALQYAHQEGVVHRDIKPENILLDKRGRVKIADFGLAKLLDNSTLTRNLTATNQVMGTVGYMAPEQMVGSKQVDHRADLYAVGVVFYELLTGELPLGRFAPPSHKVQIDVRLDEVVLKTLEKEPDRRYQHASLIKQDVEQISRGPMPAAPAVRPKTLVETMPWLKNPTLAGVALLVLGLLEFGLFFMGMVQMTEMRITNSEMNKTWVIFTMMDLAAGLGVAVAGLLIIWRKHWLLAVLGSLVAMVPAAQMASFIKPVDAENSTLEQLIALAERQGIKFNPSRTEENSYSFEARLLRDKILNLRPGDRKGVDQLVFVRWPTYLVTWLSIPAGLWALLLLLRPEVKATFGSVLGAMMSRLSSRKNLVQVSPEVGTRDQGLVVGFNGLLTIVSLGLGAAFVVWISSAFLTGQPMRMPIYGTSNAHDHTWIFGTIGLGLVWMGIVFFNHVMHHLKTVGFNTTNRSQFGFLALLLLSGGMILLFIIIKNEKDGETLDHYFSNTIAYGSEAAGWIAGLLVGGGIALVLALAPIDRRAAWKLAMWAGILLVVVVIFHALVVALM